MKADKTPGGDTPRLPRTVRRCARWLLWSGPLVLLLLAGLPTLLCWTPLGNRLVGWVLAGTPYRAEVRQVSFGWITPLRVEGLQLSRSAGAGRVDVARFATERSLFDLLLDRRDLGSLRVEQPQVAVVLADPPLKSSSRSGTGTTRSPRSAGVPSFAARIEDAQFTLRETANAEPVVALSDIDVQLRLQGGDGAARLSIQPVTIFDHERLTPGMCNRGLQLVAPILADAVHVQGDVSCEFTRCEVPLSGDPRQSLAAAQVQGVLQLHSVETGAKNPLLERLGRVLSRLLDMPYPERVRIAEDCRVAFELRGGRVYHEGLAFGLPQVSQELVFRTSGYVGFDESLELMIEIPLPATLLADGPLARRIASRPLMLEVSGTLQQPRVGLPKESSVWQEVTARLLEIDPEAAGQGEAQIVVEAAESAVQAAGELMRQRRERVESGEASPLFERLRQRLRARRAEGNDEPAPQAAEPLRGGDRLRLFRPRVEPEAVRPDAVRPEAVRPEAIAPGRGREF